MKTIVVHQSIRAQLGDLAEMLELRDEAGHLLGYYAPVVSRGARMYEGVEIPVTDEEVQELLKQPSGRPLSDILADLERAS